MEDFWNRMLTSGSIPYFVILPMAILFYLLSKLDLTTILKLWLDWRLSKTRRLTELAEDPSLPQPMRDALRETYESQVFCDQYGISAHQAMRQALIDLNKTYPDTVTWRDLRRAHLNDYIEFVNGQLTINMRRAKNNFGAFLRLFPTFLILVILVLCALTFLAIGIYLQLTGNPGLPQLAIFAEIILGLAWLFSLEWWRPFQSAKKIKDLLDRDATM